jgi:hypothetical protein
MVRGVRVQCMWSVCGVPGVCRLPYFSQVLTFCSLARRPQDRLRIGHTRPSSPFPLPSPPHFLSLPVELLAS